MGSLGGPAQATAVRPQREGWPTTHGGAAVEAETSSSDDEFADALEVLVGDNPSPTDQERPLPPADDTEQVTKHRGPTFRTAAQAVAAGARLRQQSQNRRARLRVMPNPPLRRTADVQGAAFILYSFTVQQWQRGVPVSKAWRDVQQLNVRYSSARCDGFPACPIVPPAPCLY